MERNRGYRYIFWGIFLNLFHINLGQIQILPHFLALLLVAKGIGIIQQAGGNEALEKAKKVCFAYAAAEFIMFLLNLEIMVQYIEGSGQRIVAFAGLITLSVLHISMLFFVFEGTALIFQEVGCLNSAKQMERYCMVYPILYTGNCVLVGLGLIVHSGGAVLISTLLVVMLSLWLLVTVGFIRRHFHAA